MSCPTVSEGCPYTSIGTVFLILGWVFGSLDFYLAFWLLSFGILDDLQLGDTDTVGNGIFPFFRLGYFVDVLR